MALSKLALLLAIAAQSGPGEAFSQNDNGAWNARFAELHADLYTAPLPAALESQCRNKGMSSLNQVTVTGNKLSSELSATCGANSLCVIEGDVDVDQDWNVGALVVKGSLTLSGGHWICAGYVVAEDAGVIKITDEAIVYIKNNGATHAVLRTRALGSVAARGSTLKPTLDIQGNAMARTWSLLASPASPGTTTIELLHDATAMGWRVGDRLAIAPTAPSQQERTEAANIVAIDGTRITLSAPIVAEKRAEFLATTHAVSLAAEVINLRRDVLITGDPFEEIPCQSREVLDASGPSVVSEMGESHWSGCMCTSAKQTCTMGLHTKAIGGGPTRISHVRIETCGQRGVFGKYCAHFHEHGECADGACVFEGNAVEGGVQRGLIVHNTHLAKVEHNVFHAVRGPALYVQDGLETYNRFMYNVALCHRTRSDDGCTIPGTDNSQADTDSNVAAFWSISATQDLIGNRFANYFNEYMIEVDSPFGDGTGRANGQVCAGGLSLGRVEGNMFHSSARFGTYFIGENFPVNTDRALISPFSGQTSRASCEAFDTQGNDRGLPGQLKYNVDWGNNFVGTYYQGDVQYASHTSIESANGIYWKMTKSFSDGCSSHIKDTYFRQSNLLVPDAPGAFVFENVELRGPDYWQILEANHHCGAGRTGMLCSPVYVLENVRGVFNKITGLDRGVVVLAPGTTDSEMFPNGYVAHADAQFGAYLLASPDCDRADSLGAEYATRFGAGGVLCKRQLRVLRFWQMGDGPSALEARLFLSGAPAGSTILNRVDHWFWGFAMPVLIGDGVRYEVSAQGGGGIPESWVIAFSDPIFGNKWAVDELDLTVTGRSCGRIDSMHDRRFIFASPAASLGDEARGRGACTAHPPMPRVDCAAETPLGLDACPELCDADCGEGAYCRCGVGQCTCESGRSGPDCSLDVDCGAHGHAVARFFGGALPVAGKQCICDDGWTGDRCEVNACAGVTCSGHGRCTAADDGSKAYQCICEEGYLGRDCDHSCVGRCRGAWPHGCAGWLEVGFCEGSGGPTCYYSKDNLPSGYDWCPYTNGALGDAVPRPTPQPTPRLRGTPRPTPRPTPRCGVATCTEAVWNTVVEGPNAVAPCGSRIDWVVANMGMGEAEACQFVGEEFPDVCGACAPGGVDPPGQTPRPTPKPTTQPTTLRPTPRPTIRDTPQPSREPSKEPTRQPTKQPSNEPTRKPTPRPILLSTNLPTEAEVYDCTLVDEDPWLGGSFTSCCTGLEQCTEPRDPSSAWFAQYPTVEMCRSTCGAENREPSKEPTREPTRKPTTTTLAPACTAVDEDPWTGGTYTSCCSGLAQCTEDRDPTSEWFSQYPTVEMCRTACETSDECTATIILWVFAVPNADKVFARGSFAGTVEMVDEGWSFYKAEIQVEPGSSHHYVISIPTSPGAPDDVVSRPPRGSSCDFDGEANYGFVAPSTCGGVLSLPAYEWQNGCECAGC